MAHKSVFSASRHHRVTNRSKSSLFNILVFGHYRFEDVILLFVIALLLHIQLDSLVLQQSFRMLEEEKHQLNLSTQNLHEGHYHHHHPHHQNSPYTPEQETNRVRHVYLQEQNVYGRFTPFLLLKDKLHSQIDSSGTSALVHMCSHNSPYLPLYLSTLKCGDPVLNRPTNLGHTPLDVAGMYCRREYVELLKQKGAVDDGKVDCWAIQGANIANWSGQVDSSKKALIHWAAYNNLPEVLQKFYEAGANVHEPDEKGNTPIDMAVLNKSYESVQVLARMGYTPKQTLLQQSDSPYLNNLFKQLYRSPASKLFQKSLKLTFVPLLLLSQYFLHPHANIYLIFLALALMSFLVSVFPGQDSKERPTAFFSELVNQPIVYGYNHLAYMSFMLILVMNCLSTAINLEVTSLWLGFYYWTNIAILGAFSINLGVLIYGVLTNTTPSEMFQSHKHPQLWKKIQYITHKNMVIRVYKNQNRKDTMTNLAFYLNYRRPQ